MSQPILKTAEEIAIMREAGRITARALQAMREALRPGMSTLQLDAIAEMVIRDHGATPAFLHYQPHPQRPPYPATITACINDELVHGIPRADRKLREGDIVSLDTACVYQGFVGDAAFTAAIGDVPTAVQRLLSITEQTLEHAIKASIVGNHISDVARATADFAAKHGYAVARDYTGHGVGRRMHEPPQVPNWWPSKTRARQQRAWDDVPLQPGMTYAIEPMLIAGGGEVYELEDGWTVATRDGALCAHCEHTIAITADGPIILTLL